MLKCNDNDEETNRWTTRGFFITNGILYHYPLNQDNDEEDAQLVIPTHEKEEVLKKYHDAPTAGHFGAERTIARIAIRYYWRGMRRDITAHVSKCLACQRYKASNRKPAGLLQSPNKHFFYYRRLG